MNYNNALPGRGLCYLFREINQAIAYCSAGSTVRLEKPREIYCAGYATPGIKTPAFPKKFRIETKKPFLHFSFLLLTATLVFILPASGRGAESDRLLKVVRQSPEQGGLQKMFEASYPNLVIPSKESRSLTEVDAEEKEITEVGVEHAPWYFAGDAVYTVVIKADGSFVYTGIKNVKHLGKHTGHLATIDVNPLFQYVRGMDFFALSEFYSTLATDQPTVYLMATRNGKRKIVKNDGVAGPLKLWALDKMIEGLIENAAWEKVK